jgi:hypothetical protein
LSALAWHVTLSVQGGGWRAGGVPVAKKSFFSACSAASRDKEFIAYTGEVCTFIPARVIPLLAWSATDYSVFAASAAAVLVGRAARKP